ncbi:FAD-dependent oxidoreductase [Bradyrhizobium sp. HKCCYLS1011]|uniref:FAD-dependent oxidoreductase n=1 Tax=Bradyrhizobium sp. HKCCYLS1011 TaxID=3420733 RepID=UPI003EC0619E
MSRLRQRAIVIGAGMGGLSAAGALSPYFGEVVVLDRDTLPSSTAPRAGTPQDRHPHGLLAGGLQALNALLPGFERALADAGAVPINAFRDIQFERPDVGPLPRRDCGTTILSASRPLIEAVLRQRVAALANVTLRSDCRVTELLADGIRPSVRFVSGDGALSTLEADLVIDAGGRGALTLALLDKLGLPRPAETAVGVDISYTTAVLPWPAGEARDWELAATHADPPGLTTAAILMPTGEDRCLLTLSEHHAPTRPQTWEEMLTALRRVKTQTVYNAVRHLTPLEGLRHFVLDESCWRHFERLERLPDGVLPIADSLCRFNPIYGQGMTVAALQAKLLRDSLGRVAGEADPIAALQRQFMTEVGPLLLAPWGMGVNADFAYPGTRGERPERYDESQQFEAALFRAVVADPVVQTAFSDVIQLVKPFELLQSPDIQRRIEAHAQAPADRMQASAS